MEKYRWKSGKTKHLQHRSDSTREGHVNPIGVCERRWTEFKYLFHTDDLDQPTGKVFEQMKCYVAIL